MSYQVINRFFDETLAISYKFLESRFKLFYMADIVSYLSFSGNCEEAMNFYKDCLGGEVTFMRFSGTQMAASTPANMQEKIMHSVLNSGSMMLMGSDMADPSVAPNSRSSICIICNSADQLKDFYSKLVVGGKEHQAPQDEFFGTYADFTDKYGFSWMLQYSADNNASA